MRCIFCLLVFRLAVAEIFAVTMKVRTFGKPGRRGYDNIKVDVK